MGKNLGYFRMILEKMFFFHPYNFIKAASFSGHVNVNFSYVLSTDVSKVYLKLTKAQDYKIKQTGNTSFFYFDSFEATN